MTAEKNKFNIGDLVIDLSNVELWDNVYHFEKFFNLLKNAKTVKKIQQLSVGKGYFTTDETINLDSYEEIHNLRNQMKIYYMVNGENLIGGSRVHNWTTNEKGIRKYLNDKFEEALKKCNEEDEKAISDIEVQIANLQAKLDKIKKGDRPVSFEPKINARGFLQERIGEINNFLDSIKN